VIKKINPISFQLIPKIRRHSKLPVLVKTLALTFSASLLTHSALAATDIQTENASTTNSALNQPTETDGAVEQLDETVVSATRSELKAVLAPANATVINEKNTQNRLSQRIGDELLEVPGVYMRGSAYGTSVPGSGMGGVSIHGVTDTRRSLFMVDGLPVNSGAANIVDWNTLDLNAAKQVEFVPGPFSALYGSSAMGGVINVITQEPTKREGLLTAGGGGGAADQWGVKGKYLDRFENGLGLSLTYGHMDSSNWSNMDPVIVSPSGTPAGGATLVSGAVPTATNASGAPATGYLVGYKGARNWSQDNASLHLFQDITEQTKLDGGMAWTRSVVTKTSPVDLLTTSNGTPLTLGTVANSSNPSYNLSIGGQAQHLYQSTFLNALPQIEDTRRYFGHLKHDFGGDIKLNGDFQYMENTYNYPSTSQTDTYTSGPGTASSQPNHRIDGNLGLRFPLLSENRNFMTVGFGYNRNVLDASQKAATSNWTDLIRSPQSTV
jgi:iron complex outermembrane receptor protein